MIFTFGQYLVEDTICSGVFFLTRNVNQCITDSGMYLRTFHTMGEINHDGWE